MQPIRFSILKTVAPTTNQDLSQKRAALRRWRLSKKQNHVVEAVLLDLLWGAGPWLLGTCAVAAGLWAIYENVNGAAAFYKQLESPGALGAISTFSAFLLVSKIQANLNCNSSIIKEFNSLSGSLINLALFVKSQMLGQKRAVTNVTLLDGNGSNSVYETNKIGMTLSSVPYVVKYVGRGVHVDPQGLPLGQDEQLVKKYLEYTTSGLKGSAESMKPFTALILMLGEQLDQIQRGESKDSEYTVLFTQLNAVTSSQGTIKALTGYNPPHILDGLLFIVFILYLGLALVSDLIPNNGANSIWISAIISFSTIVFFQISDRYWNPMTLRSQRSGQEPLISQMCVSTELAITAVFQSANPYPL